MDKRKMEDSNRSHGRNESIVIERVVNIKVTVKVLEQNMTDSRQLLSREVDQIELFQAICK